MATVRIQFVSKTSSLYGDPVVIETDYVPSVGELITTSAEPHPYNLEGGTFMVVSVTSRLTDSGFEPHLTVRQWYKGLREEVLAERGWLVAPDGVDHVHDEDDPGFPD